MTAGVLIGIDGSCWANRRGFGRFTRGLVGAMVECGSSHRWVMLLDSISASDPDLPAIPPQLDVRTVEVGAAPAEAAAAAHGRSIADLARMSRAAARLAADCFFFPASYSYYPVLRSPVVVTVHDAIAETLPDLTLSSRADRFRWRLKQRTALLEARAVLTVSETSRAAIAHALRVRPSRIHVIREAPEERFRPQTVAERAPALAKLGISTEERFILYVGGISPHKNIPVLIEAFEAVAAEHGDVRLVLAGDADHDPFLSAGTTVRAAIERSQVGGRILLTGRVSDDELVALYNGAVATVQPSLGEGFGLTAAESAACATPVVASTDRALRELLGDAGLYADATSPAAFAAHLEALLSDGGLRRTISEAVHALAATWSWTTGADATIDLLERTARARG